MCATKLNKDENSPVEDDENILRRILNRKDYYDPSLDIPVQRLAFKPTDKDTNGISVYRSMFVTPKEVADTGPNDNGYHVAQLQVGEVLGGNMTVLSDPLPKTNPTYLPGHAAIPEVNINDYKASKANKTRIKGLQLELAILASKDIAYSSAK